MDQHSTDPSPVGKMLGKKCNDMMNEGKDSILPD